jgi:hypothetical protein
MLLMEELRKRGRVYVFPDNAITKITDDQAYVRLRGGKRGLVIV